MAKALGVAWPPGHAKTKRIAALHYSECWGAPRASDGAYTATNSKGTTNKKRFYSKEATGAFFTPEEAALERAKSIA